MKTLPLAAALGLLLAHSARAGMLCDESCTLIIDFPAGGSIAAAAPLTVTFGDGGLVDTVGSVTAYLAGETLALDAGETLEFEAGGHFDLGAAGNIDFTDMRITTDGTIDIGASGGAGQVIVEAGSRLLLDGEVTLQGAFVVQVDGILELGAGGELHSSEPGDPLDASLQNLSGGSITISGGSLFDDSGAGPTLTGTLTIGTDPGVEPGQLLVTLNGGDQVVSADSLLTAEPPAVTGVSVEIDPAGDGGAERQRNDELESAFGLGWSLLLPLGCVAGWRRRRQSVDGRRAP